MSATPSKADLRATALAKREALSDKQREAAAKALARRGLPLPIAAGQVVSGYSPIRNEIDPVPLMQKLALQGARLALPAVVSRGKSLIFRAWSPNDRLMLGPLGIPERSMEARQPEPAVGVERLGLPGERVGGEAEHRHVGGSRKGGEQCVVVPTGGGEIDDD